MKICANEARRLKSKIEFRRLMEKMKKRFLGLPGAVRSLRIFEEVVVDLVRRICKVGKGAQVENLLFYLVCLRKRRRWAFSLFKQIRFRPGIHQPFRGFFGLIFPTKRIFEPTVLLLKKNSEMSTLSGSSPVFVSQALAAQTF